MSRILDALARRARTTPDAPALADGAVVYGWADLQRGVDDATSWLRSMLDGLSPGAPVAVALDNGPAWVMTDLALMTLGRVALPLPPFFTPQQSQHAMADAGAGLLVRPSSQGKVLAKTTVAAERLDLPTRALHPGTAKVTYTSGSTGTPKGVCLSLTQLEAVAGSLVEVIGAEYAGRHLAVLPLGVLLENVAGLYPTLLAGGCYEARSLGDLGFAEGVTPDIGRLARVAEACGATSMILVPELLRGLMAWLAATGARLPELKLVAVGGAKVAPQLIAAARAQGLPAFEGYGLSECGSVVALNTPRADRPGAVGRVLPHIEVSIGADGEIEVGPQPFLGYVGGPAQAGPVRTGDLGKLDPWGWLSITGRKSNLLITAFGRNVAPEWVESELLAEPEIAQAAVFGDAAVSLCALVVPSRGASSGLEQAVQRVNARLPHYARIGRWLDAAPFDSSRGEITANGRPRREALRAAHRDFIDHQI